MTLPIQPCLRGPRRPPAAGVFLVLAMSLTAACDTPVSRQIDAAASAEALIDAHSLVRSGVTLGGAALGPGERLYILGERIASRYPEQL